MAHAQGVDDADGHVIAGHVQRWQCAHCVAGVIDFGDELTHPDRTGIGGLGCWVGEEVGWEEVRSTRHVVPGDSIPDVSKVESVYVPLLTIDLDREIGGLAPSKS